MVLARTRGRAGANALFCKLRRRGLRAIFAERAEIQASCEGVEARLATRNSLCSKFERE